MSPEFLRRYYILRIISKPKVYGINHNGYVPLEELQKALELKRNEFYDNPLYEKLTSHSCKTIRRDIKAIENYFDVTISLKKNCGYYIKDFVQSKDLKEIYDRTELFLLNQKTTEWKDLISVEESSLNGTVDFSSLINAIEQNLLVHIVFDGWYEDNVFTRYEGYIQPLHIKEAYKAWYLIGHNEKIGIYTFCLDSRVKELIVTSKKVENPISFNEKEYFKNSIGILNERGIKPERIVIKVANHHFRHLLDKALHPSQKILSYPILPETETTDYDNPDIWGKIEVCLQPNYEFMMEILRYNRWVQVVSPKNVVDVIVKHVEYMYAYYR